MRLSGTCRGVAHLRVVDPVPALRQHRLGHAVLQAVGQARDRVSAPAVQAACHRIVQVPQRHQQRVVACASASARVRAVEVSDDDVRRTPPAEASMPCLACHLK